MTIFVNEEYLKIPRAIFFQDVHLMTDSVRRFSGLWETFFQYIFIILVENQKLHKISKSQYGILQYQYMTVDILSKIDRRKL